MNLAFATKDQIGVWRSTTKPKKDGEQERPSTYVRLYIEKDEEGKQSAYLLATDGYQLMKRAIALEAGAEETTMAIPSAAVEQADKAMQQGDRAYFGDEGKIIVRELLPDEDTGDEESRIKAIIPFDQQLEIDGDWRGALEKVINKGAPDRIVTLDSKVLKRVVEQMKSGKATVHVTLHMHDGEDAKHGVLLTALEETEEEQITAVVMPIYT